MSFDYSQHYRKWHPDTAEHRLAMDSYYRRILAHKLPGSKAADILDLGCGAGYCLMALKNLGYVHAEGVDSDAGQIKACHALGLSQVTLSHDTVAFLKAKAGAFDTIIAFDFIEHFSREAQLTYVQVMTGALKPGGQLICTVPNANSALAGRYRYIDWTHHASFTEHSLDFLLRYGGFAEVKVTEIESIVRPKNVWLPVSGARHWWAFRFFRLFRRLEMMAELGPQQGRQVPLSLNLMAVATKS